MSLESSPRESQWTEAAAAVFNLGKASSLNSCYDDVEPWALAASRTRNEILPLPAITPSFVWFRARCRNVGLLLNFAGRDALATAGDAGATVSLAFVALAGRVTCLR